MLQCLVSLIVPFALVLANQNDLRITHGPILGRPGPHQIGVWIRTNRPARFWVRLGTSADHLDILAGPGETRIDHDNTGWLLVTGLSPDTRYYYRVVLSPDADLSSAPGASFRTWPASEQFRHPDLNPRGLFNFAFEFGCGNNQNPRQGIGPTLPAFATMLRELQDEIHFAIQNGDWLYEENRDYPVSAWLEQVGIAAEEAPRVVRIAPTIVGVWENYKTYLRRGKNLARWHQHIPSFFTFDDHEILNDVYGCGTPGLQDRRAVFRDIGVRAWYDYLGWSNPVSFQQGIYFGRAKLEANSDILLDPEADFSTLDLNQAANLHVHWGTPDAGVNDNRLDRLPPGNPNAGVYEIVEVLDRNRLRIRPAARATGEASYSIGRLSYYRFSLANCDFFVLDTRSHREMHDISQPDKPGISMIGQRQKRWLIDGMRHSDADFLFVVSSVNLMIPHVGGGAIRESNKDDAWTVFLQEREELIRFWDSLGKPVFVLTGDLHNSFAIRITDHVWEFASAPHNSGNHRAADEGNRPPNGFFNSRGRLCQILWSSYFLNDIPRELLRQPHYCVVRVRNVFPNPAPDGTTRYIAYPRPHVVFEYYDGYTGRPLYARPVHALTLR